MNHRLPIFFLWLAAFTTACSAPQPLPAPQRFALPTQAQVVGDWDDIETSVITGASQSQIAVERILTPEPDRITYELRTITDEPGTLDVRLLPDPAATSLEARQIQFTAQVGRFGDAAWQERLIGRVRARLEDLRGVGVAPIRTR